MSGQGLIGFMAATFVLAYPQDRLRANVPNVHAHGDNSS
jgi:hypothetical protein